MASLMPNKKYPHLFAIIRWDADCGDDAPLDFRITVKKVVTDPNYAAREVERLNRLNKDKGSYYFYQITRFEEMPIEAHELNNPSSESVSSANINGTLLGSHSPHTPAISSETRESA